MAIYYIETTIPSFYHEVRSEPEMVARRDWTRRWYDVAVTSDRIVSSAAVLDELRRGDFPGRDDCLRMLSTIEMLELNDPVFEIVEAYLANKLMPADPFGFTNGLPHNGRDGNLGVGRYWLAMGQFNTTYGATNWNVTSTGTGSGTVLMNFRTDGPVPEPASILALSAGAAALLRRRRKA